MTKRRNPSAGRKKRNEHIYATTTGEVTSIKGTFNALTGEVSFDGEMTNVYSEVNYDRAKGPKILSRVPQAHSQLSFDASPALQKNYDFLCAVDTNTKSIAGRTVSVVAAVILRRQGLRLQSGLETGWRCEVPFCLEYVGLKADKPEYFGWLAALETLIKRGYVKAAQRIGLIVDSDLDNIRAYNHSELSFSPRTFSSSTRPPTAAKRMSSASRWASPIPRRRNAWPHSKAAGRRSMMSSSTIRCLNG